jgi:hypothetical protein
VFTENIEAALSQPVSTPVQSHGSIFPQRVQRSIMRRLQLQKIKRNKDVCGRRVMLVESAAATRGSTSTGRFLRHCTKILCLISSRGLMLRERI